MAAQSVLLSGIVSLVVAVASSLFITEYRFRRERERRRKDRVREYENNCKSTLRNAHRKWIELRHSDKIPRDSNISPSELAQKSDSELLSLLDEYVVEIEELTSSSPEEYEGSNLTFHMEEISRLYREPPSSCMDQSHFDRWKAMASQMDNALDEL